RKGGQPSRPSLRLYKTDRRAAGRGDLGLADRTARGGVMRLLITGASGQLGAYLLRELQDQADVIAWSGSSRGRLFGFPLHPVDLGDADAVAAAFREARPEAILHAGAWARVADCCRDPQGARRVNTRGTAQLAELAAAIGSRLVMVSTDLVFDGECAP